MRSLGPGCGVRAAGIVVHQPPMPRCVSSVRLRSSSMSRCLPTARTDSTSCPARGVERKPLAEPDALEPPTLQQRRDPQLRLPQRVSLGHRPDATTAAAQRPAAASSSRMPRAISFATVFGNMRLSRQSRPARPGSRAPDRAAPRRRPGRRARAGASGLPGTRREVAPHAEARRAPRPRRAGASRPARDRPRSRRRRDAPPRAGGCARARPPRTSSSRTG